MSQVDLPPLPGRAATANAAGDLPMDYLIPSGEGGGDLIYSSVASYIFYLHIY